MEKFNADELHPRLEQSPVTGHLSSLPADVDVVIAGGGPSGLFLALDLARRGVRSVLLEPRAELDWLRPRAKTTNARTMTHLRRVGLADELRAAAPLPVSYADSVAFCTSLTGVELTRFSNAFQLQQGRYLPQPECGQQVAQPVVEQVLRAAVQRNPLCTLRLGAAYVDSSPTRGGRHVTVSDVDGVRREIDCRFLIGADGVASRVRRTVGLRLEGSSAAKSNLGVLFRSRQLADAVTLEPAVQFWVIGDTYAGMVGPMDQDGLWWSILQGYDESAPAFAGVPREDILRALIGADVDIEVIAEDPWTARMLLAPSYRSDAVFLVGDAAHANPPWGGHGFNTCIGDAANLAWKLAAVLQGWAGPGLLDSYEEERRPVARRTIDDATANGSVLADDLVDERIAEPGSEGDEARRRTAERLSVKESEFESLGLVLGYAYPESSTVTAAGAPAPAPDPIRYTPSAAPGCLLPHTWLAGDTSLYDVLDADGFTLLVEAEAMIEEHAMNHLAAEVPLAVRLVGHPDGSFASIWEAPMLLVRPDQHVAWRGNDVAALATALQRAAGHPHPEHNATAVVA
jgi:2-polyprenyl-6-methoxyphenol hydroxylase-like FAD-dependent oxidoreductase